MTHEPIQPQAMNPAPERWNVWCTDYDGYALAEDSGSKEEIMQLMVSHSMVGDPQYIPVRKDGEHFPAALGAKTS